VIVEQVRLIAVTMRIRHLPPHVNRQMRSQLLLELPPRPERPTRDVVMADGHTEQVPVGKGSEEYDQWQVALADWQSQRQQMEEDIALRFNALLEDYCCLAWRWHGTDEWHEQPPEEWKYPIELESHSIPGINNRKLDYLRTVVLVGVNDIATLYEAVVLTDLEDREVQLHLDGFPVICLADSGDSFDKASGQRDMEHDVSRGDGDGTGIRNVARRLVQAITGRTGGSGSASSRREHYRVE